MELVSVVIPVYNAERYLERCVRSVLEQSYPELQVILVEDGSTDASPALCDAWAGDRVQVIHQPNGGVASPQPAESTFFNWTAMITALARHYVEGCASKKLSLAY